MNHSKALKHLAEMREAKVVEAINWHLGHTRWSWPEVMHRGKWTEYPDGEAVFSFDGEEKFLIGPIEERSDGKLEQRFEKLSEYPKLS